jgi:hypothetical protein
MTIEILKSEAKAGLKELIEDNVVKASATVKSFKKIGFDELNKVSQTKVQKSNASANPGQIDLYYLEMVLVSTGWNKNDDVFLPSETWAARHTPEDKMFNYMHDDGDIIGHITSSYVEDFDGNLIPDNTPDSEVPSNFNIITPSVIYSKISNDEKRERILSIMDDIESGGGEWKDSMECLFSAFDYAAVNLKTNEQVLIPRDETSASLTKHLRCYGGDGIYQDYKIGRAIKKQTFSGVGLVDEPANERSIVRSAAISIPVDTGWTFSDNNTTTFTSSTAHNLILDDVTLNNITEETNMADTNDTATKAELAQAKEELKTLRAEMDKKREEEVKATTENLNKTISEKEDTIKDLETSVSSKDDEIKELEAKIETLETEKETAEKSVAKLEKEKVVASRKAQLITAGADEDEADSLLEEWAEATDKQFEKVISLVEKAAKAEFHKEHDDKKKKKEEEAMKKYKASDDEEEDDDASAALDDLEEDDKSTAALNSDSDDEETGKVQKSLASYFERNIK